MPASSVPVIPPELVAFGVGTVIGPVDVAVDVLPVLWTVGTGSPVSELLELAAAPLELDPAALAPTGASAAVRRTAAAKVTTARPREASRAGRGRRSIAAI